MEAKEKALRICQEMGRSTLFAEDCNGGYTLPLRVAKICALVVVNEVLEETKEPVFPMAGATGWDYDTYWLDVKAEIEKL